MTVAAKQVPRDKTFMLFVDDAMPPSARGMRPSWTTNRIVEESPAQMADIFDELFTADIVAHLKT